MKDLEFEINEQYTSKQSKERMAPFIVNQKDKNFVYSNDTGPKSKINPELIQTNINFKSFKETDIHNQLPQHFHRRTDQEILKQMNLV